MSHTELYEKMAKPYEMVEATLLSLAGAGDPFEVDQAVTDEPTLSITLTDPTIKRFLLTEVSYYMLPDNAVTYALLLFEGAEADDPTSFSKKLFVSGGVQAKDTVYIRCNIEDKLPRVVDLDTEGIIYYLLNWSAAPGNCPGFIRLRGKKLA